MQITLNITDRFNLINTIGELRSDRETLSRLDSLLSTLALTRDEASDPSLALRFNQENGSFEYNIEYDKLVSVNIDDDLLEVLGLNV